MSRTNPEGARPQVVEGEFPFSAEDFRRIASMLHAEAGIVLADGKATLVYSRLVKRLRALGLRSFRDYCALVAGDEGADERQRMIAALTTNVTRFFREPHHFEQLKRSVLPPLVARARRGEPVRIWSAGCSNGQEPYSIGLTLLEVMPDAAEHDVRILATDIDVNMIAEGRAGIYPDAALQPAPAGLRDRYFERVSGPSGPAWSAGEELRTLIAFRELNLIGPSWPIKRRFHAIFCRNVLIYFDEPTQSKIFDRFIPLMEPTARLFIGHSERVCGPALAKVETDGVTAYRLAGAPA